MRKKALLKVLVIVSIFFLSGVSIAADYTADFVTMSQGEKVATGKVFIKGDMLRQETVTKERERFIMILRPDKNEVWMVNPKEKKYMVVPFDKSDEKIQKWTNNKQKKSKYLGKEKVSGLKCKKYEMTEKGRKTYFWTSDKFPLPVKVKYEDGYMQYKNIKKKRLSSSVFEAPSGYQKMVMPSINRMRPQSMTPSQREEQKTTGGGGEESRASKVLKDASESVNKSVNKLMDMFKKK